MKRKPIHLIVPMAGLGTRFGGYDKPKPLIIYRYEPLFVNAVRSVLGKLKFATVTFIVRNEHIQKYEIDKIINRCFPDSSIIPIEGTTRGAAETAFIGVYDLLSSGRADFNDGMLVMDCDLCYCKSFPILSRKNIENLDGCLFSFKSDNPKYSFVIIDGVDYSARATFEKDNSYTDNAITAPYYIGNMGDFVDAFHSLERKFENKEHTGELYMSNIYNELPQYLLQP